MMANERRPTQSAATHFRQSFSAKNLTRPILPAPQIRDAPVYIRTMTR